MNLDDLANPPMTLAEVEAMRRGEPISKGPSRLEDRIAKAKAFDLAWDACKRKVDLRDKFKCRACKRKTVKTLTLCPERAEHHHLVRRKKEPALLVDQRNIVLLCHACHEQATQRQIDPIGEAAHMFELNGKQYLNADHPLSWVA